MEYSYYNNQQPTTFHQQQFNGFPTTGSDFVQNTSTHQPQGTFTNGLQHFDQSYPFNGNASFAPQPPPQQQPSPPHHNDSSESMMFIDGVQSSNGSTKNGLGIETLEQDGNSSGDEKGPSPPVQSKRKAQNRAAQRAFRERKEKHVKELENKVDALSTHSSTLISDNERLKRELQRLATQNEILRATASHPSSAGHPAAVRSPSPVHGPQVFTPIDFQSSVGESAWPVSFEDYGGPMGHRLLAIGAAWDYIINSESYQMGKVDIDAVQKKLTGKAVCSGRGPAFQEQHVIQAIQESIVDDGLL